MSRTLDVKAPGFSPEPVSIFKEYRPFGIRERSRTTDLEVMEPSDII